jgi:basic membrane lipoprotein Med (substrate-binding protein (PBP1-ABC) superfamily)
MTKSPITVAAISIAAIALLSGCGQKYAAERDGKKVGEAICDLRDAETAEEAQAALEDVNKELGDLGDKYAIYTAEDRADIQNNLADLSEHTIQGQENLANQDLTVLERSAKNIAEDANETSQAAWDGVREGLADCTQG